MPLGTIGFLDPEIFEAFHKRFEFLILFNLSISIFHPVILTENAYQLTIGK